ncbi:hypothetical protein EYC80_001140 [Monilinia laxa]|uniref:Zn(2)-C6 fungal-type domain-containing protein n=1 Tax=Monilinia laxa TaxID=61186 RepID=A0A5N6K8B2_MONLA|nr:hypothetical protein EYC80_001140 [Monilinia laxa]
MTNSHDIKPPKVSKQGARKRKRESTSENSGLTSALESGKRNKRATRACERCRNKKIKCDIERDIACNACVDANVVCEAGNGKHTEDKKYPPGYTESLENTYQAMILVTDKLWRMVKNREEWTFAEPRMKDGGKGPVVIHDIAQALGCIRNAPGLPECFVEDAPALLNRLSSEEESKVKREAQTETTTSTEEASLESQSKLPQSSPRFQVASPTELPPPSYSSQFPQSPKVDQYIQTKPSIQLQCQSPDKFPPQAPMSKLASVDQSFDVSRPQHEPLTGSSNIHQSHKVNKLTSDFSGSMSWCNRINTTLDSRRTPGLTIQSQPYQYQEQQALSASSTVSPFSPTCHTNSPFQSTVSSFSPTYQANSPLSSETSYEGDSSLSSSPYLPNLQKDPYFPSVHHLDDAETQLFHDLNTPLGFCDSMFTFDVGFSDLSGSLFPVEDEPYSQDLLLKVSYDSDPVTTNFVVSPDHGLLATEFQGQEQIPWRLFINKTLDWMSTLGIHAWFGNGIHFVHYSAVIIQLCVVVSFDKQLG